MFIEFNLWGLFSTVQLCEGNRLIRQVWVEQREKRYWYLDFAIMLRVSFRVRGQRLSNLFKYLINQYEIGNERIEIPKGLYQ